MLLIRRLAKIHQVKSLKRLCLAHADASWRSDRHARWMVLSSAQVSKSMHPHARQSATPRAQQAQTVDGGVDFGGFAFGECPLLAGCRVSADAAGKQAADSARWNPAAGPS